MLTQAGVNVKLGERLRERDGVAVAAHRIQRIETESGQAYAAPVFIDASYEGDLTAQAGVTTIVGREARSAYGEALAGVQPAVAISPQQRGTAANGSLLPQVDTGKAGALGARDGRIQPYTFLPCVTTKPADRVSFAAPPGYDPSRYGLLGQRLTALARLGRGPTLDDAVTITPLADGKGELQPTGPLSTDLMGGSRDYPTASYARRQQIWQDHFSYVAGLLYFLAHDPSVPSAVQTALRSWGLCRDEFADMNHWPPQLYIRESRRMVSPFVLTQQDLVAGSHQPDVIGLAASPIDTRPVRLMIGRRSLLFVEGSLHLAIARPYEIPYRILVPSQEQLTNLLDPVTVSASHVAYGSLATEPQFMEMGEAAGVAGAMAAKALIAVQSVDIGTLQSRLLAHGAPFRRPSVASKSLPWLLGAATLADFALFGFVLWRWRRRPLASQPSVSGPSV
jgi:hypothetical protein